VVENVSRRAEQTTDRTREDRQQRCCRQAHQHRDPHRLHTNVCGIRLVARAEPPSDPLGCSVRQEVRSGEDERQDRRRDGEPGELVGTEAPDDGRVDEHVGGLDRQSAEGRERKAEYPPIYRL